MANDCDNCKGFCQEHFCRSCLITATYEFYLLGGIAVSMQVIEDEVDHTHRHLDWCKCVNSCGDPVEYTAVDRTLIRSEFNVEQYDFTEDSDGG